jgi:hypothetical protein
MKQRLKFVWIMLLGAGALLFALYTFQDRLLFHPQTLDIGNERQLAQHPQIEQLDIANEDATGSTHLRGWLLKPKLAASKTLSLNKYLASAD